ncbi:amino acid ABC transporter permease [Chelativorans sp. M5D2P16]|uniref:amino acid ABC transporter permease n=1 Tax=Chelativorans sp. M5D2P16 TaxID=3095678 RepID=UPI002ACAE6F0|nr:amino acid ABC transporter permease [Chelativorans sp. M5D2P16]MDZ5696857.1 amino acid ABC transporter permease [Chelativorans sp. M5D2P16]
MTADTHTYATHGRVSLMRDPRIRGLIIQIVMIIAILAFAAWLVNNTVRNLTQANIAGGFGFLSSRAGFDIGQVPIDYTANSTYGRALLVGATNTVIVAASGIALATIIGFIIGIARLSRNYLVRGLSTIYVETFRNIPPLLVILFWYFGVLAILPGPREALELPLGAYLSNRGLQTPAAVFEPIALVALIAFGLGVAGAVVLARANKRRQLQTGEIRPTFWPSVAMIVGLPLVVFALSGFPVTFEVPEATRFNLVGGWHVQPEFLALFLALSFYTASFIAEIVRAGILSVAGGQTEAASALGLTRGQTLRLVVVPQAFRVIIPPLTSQYLNLTKNTSLGLAVGYPELVAVGSTVLNQTGQSVEVVAIWMVVYLGLSVGVASFMNWFNARMALIER